MAFYLARLFFCFACRRLAPLLALLGTVFLSLRNFRLLFSSKATLLEFPLILIVIFLFAFEFSSFLPRHLESQNSLRDRYWMVRDVRR